MGLKQVITPGALPAPAMNASDARSAPRATSIAIDFTYYVDPVAGSDDGNGQAGTPWRTIERFHSWLDSFECIDSVQTCVIVNASSTPATMTSVVARFSERGKAVYLGALAGATVVATVVAAGGSTQALLRTNSAIGSDVAGCSLVCTAGANIGARRSIAEYVAGAPNLITPAELFPAAGVGDTWQIVRPSQRITWPDGVELTGRGAGMLPADANSCAGFYFCNLTLEGTPGFSLANAYLFGVEYVYSGGALYARVGSRVQFGRVDGPMSWLGLGTLARGWGLSQRRAVQTPDTAGVLVAQEASSYAGGYVAGSRWEARDAPGAIGEMIGGHLWGALDAEALAVEGPAYFDVGSPTKLSVQNVDSEDVVFASSGALVRFSGACTLAGGANGATLLRSTAQALIDVRAALAGSTTGTAQSAIGAGHILWDAQPAITGTVADLAVDGATGANALLADAPGALADSLNLSWIARRVAAGGTPTPTPVSPANVPNNVIPILLAVTPGAPVQLVAAPPAGFVNLIGTLRVVSGADVFTALVSDAIGAMGRRSVAANTSQSIVTGQVLTFCSEGAINVELTGAGAGGVFDGYAFQVPKHSGLYQRALVLTNAFQTVVNAAPAADASFPLGNGIELTPALVYTGVVFINGDSAASIFQVRLTRGATVHTFQIASTPANTQAAVQFPALLPGDLVEARVTTAPVIAGSQTFRMGMVQVQQL